MTDIGKTHVCGCSESERSMGFEFSRFSFHRQSECECEWVPLQFTNTICRNSSRETQVPINNAPLLCVLIK